MPPAASVIVRTLDAERTIGRVLDALRNQTVPVEIVVVDSGSVDSTREVAARRCDVLLDLSRDEFTYGRALNAGARAASAPYHFALSSHCVAVPGDWVERSLTHYATGEVAATNGPRYFADGRALTGVFLQDAAHARRDPHWGFSNHASSWRAAVWERFPFDEELPASEDREWALRVLDAGWTIAYDPALWVSSVHRYRGGPLRLYQRERREAAAVGRFAPLPPYTLREVVRRWWSEVPDNGRPDVVSRLNYRRVAELLGKRAGQRAARRRAPDRAPETPSGRA